MAELLTIRCPNCSAINRVPQDSPLPGVQGIPSLLVIKASREIDRIIGVQAKSEIARRLERVLAKV